jgi:hypothetical protein
MGKLRSTHRIGCVAALDSDRRCSGGRSEWAGHDLMHLVQAERAVMQAFIPGSGPWRRYFSDHDADVLPAP